MSNNITTTSADFEEITRTVGENEVSPGASTTIEVVLKREEGDPVSLGPGELVRIDDDFSPGFGDVEVKTFVPGGGEAGAGEDNEKFLAVWNEEAERYSVTYDVTVPVGASMGDTFDITGTLEVRGTQQSLPSATITVDSDATGVQLTPSNVSVDTEGNATFDLSMTGGDNGVGSYALTVEVGDTDVATITEYSLTGNPDVDDSNIAADNSSLALDVDMGDNAHAGDTSIDLAEITVAAGNEGSADLTIADGASVADSDGQSYDLEFRTGATLTVEPPGPSISDYANEDGVVDTTGLRNAIGDWRNQDIDTQLLRDVINAWRSREQVA